MDNQAPEMINVPEAGRWGKNASYAAAARGEIPVIRIRKCGRAQLGLLPEKNRIALRRA